MIDHVCSSSFPGQQVYDEVIITTSSFSQTIG